MILIALFMKNEPGKFLGLILSSDLSRKSPLFTEMVKSSSGSQVLQIFPKAAIS